MKLLSKLELNKSDLPLYCVLFIAFILRFIGLGYSDFQGDEIKALFLPDDPKNVTQFLLTQRKGPIQFLITFLVKFFDYYYTNQFLVRLPFAIAGFLAVYYFYKLLKLHFNQKVAAYASFFLATNGFFVAFSRIAQYQSFVILFSVLCLYMLSLAVTEQKMGKRGVYLAMLFWALSLLSHYDGVFILPAVIALLLQWLKVVKPGLRTVALSFLLLTALTLAFYVPFALYISQDTREYWEGRLTGDVSGKLSSSYYLFTVYQPIYVIHLYISLVAIAVAGFFLQLVPTRAKKLLSQMKILKDYFLGVTETVFKEVTTTKFLVILLWFIVALLFWEWVVYIPGTHIYTYLLPVFILMAIGLYYVENLYARITKKVKIVKPVLIKNFLFGVAMVFVAFQSYAVFVDNYNEYPWQDEKFLIWTMNKPTPMYHLSMFGFPYYRDWESISKFVNSYPEVFAYSTNERESISRFYVNLEKDTDKAGFYIFIRRPQSFTNEILNQKVLYWATSHPPVYTMSRGGTDLVSIYLMPVGTVDQLKEKGF